MSFARFSILLVFLLAIAGCKGVYFNPDFFVADHTSGGIVSERGEVILSSDERFDEFACMHIEKVKELKRLLMSKNIGGKNRALVLQQYTKLQTIMDE